SLLVSLRTAHPPRPPPPFPTRRSSDLDVDARQVAHGHRPHGHAELARHAVDLFGTGALLHQELGLAGVELEHPVADEAVAIAGRSEEHTSELQSRENLVCRLLLEKKKK